MPPHLQPSNDVLGLLPRILNLSPDTEWTPQMGRDACAVPLEDIARERSNRLDAQRAEREERQRRWNIAVGHPERNNRPVAAPTSNRTTSPTAAQCGEISRYFDVLAARAYQAAEWSWRNHPQALALGARFGEEFARDPAALARARGLGIEDRPDADSTVQGFFTASRNAIVIVNDGGSAELRLVILAHEVGHQVLNHRPAANPWTEESQELAADAFARGFLVGVPS